MTGLFTQAEPHPAHVPHDRTGAFSVLTWNLRHGGSGARLPEITLLLTSSDADLVVLTEFRDRVGGQVRAALSDRGLVHQLTSSASGARIGVLIASRCKLTPADLELDGPKALSVRVSLPPTIAAAKAGLPRPTAHIPTPITVLGVHVRDDSAGPDCCRAWRRLVDSARELRDRPTIIAGDLNAWRERRSGRSANADGLAPARRRIRTRLGRLASLGYRDAWSARTEGPGPPPTEPGVTTHPPPEPVTWVGALGERRTLDRVLASAPLAHTLVSCECNDEPIRRGFSDHAVVIARFRLDLPARRPTPGG